MTECAHPGCPATVPNHRWGRIKAVGWFFQKDGGPAWCPDHVPAWVADWRRRSRS